jgi:hypothetical protein
MQRVRSDIGNTPFVMYLGDAKAVTDSRYPGKEQEILVMPRAKIFSILKRYRVSIAIDPDFDCDLVLIPVDIKNESINPVATN